MSDTKMANVFLSTGYAAEEHSQAIQSVEGIFSQIPNLGGSITTIEVMAKMAEISQKVTATNNNYKALLSKDATAITNIKNEYDEFDKQLSECMGI